MKNKNIKKIIVALLFTLILSSCKISPQITIDKEENSMENSSNSNIEEVLRSKHKELTIEWAPEMYEIDDNRKVFSESKHGIEMMFETVYASLLAGEFLKKDQVSILVSRGEYKDFGMETTIFILNNTDEEINKIHGAFVSKQAETGEVVVSVNFDYSDNLSPIPPRTAYGLIISLEKTLDHPDGTVFTMFELDTTSDVKYEIVE